MLFLFVMPVLVTGIHVLCFLGSKEKRVDTRPTAEGRFFLDRSRPSGCGGMTKRKMSLRGAKRRSNPGLDRHAA
jgi:hypothetical protein